MAIVSMVTVKSMKSTFSGTLLSYSVANLLGGLMFLWTTLSSMLEIEVSNMNPSTVVSMVLSVILSISHMLCLVLAEYIYLSGHFKYVTESFRPLLSIMWFVAICLGSVILFLEKDTCEIISVTLVIISWVILVIFYMTVMKRYRNHRQRIVRYSKPNIRNAAMVRNIFYPRVVLAVYFLCALPWAFKEAHYVRLHLDDLDSFSYVFIMVYSLNFHVVSIVCLYLRCRQPEKNILQGSIYTTEKDISVGSPDDRYNNSYSKFNNRKHNSHNNGNVVMEMQPQSEPHTTPITSMESTPPTYRFINHAYDTDTH